MLAGANPNALRGETITAVRTISASCWQPSTNTYCKSEQWATDTIASSGAGSESYGAYRWSAAAEATPGSLKAKASSDLTGYLPGTYQLQTFPGWGLELPERSASGMAAWWDTFSTPSVADPTYVFTFSLTGSANGSHWPAEGDWSDGSFAQSYIFTSGVLAVFNRAAKADMLAGLLSPDEYYGKYVQQACVWPGAAASAFDCGDSTSDSFPISWSAALPAYKPGQPQEIEFRLFADVGVIDSRWDGTQLVTGIVTPYNVSASVDVSHTAVLEAITVLDASGNVLPGAGVVSGSGYQYPLATPEPGTWGLMGAGLAFVAWRGVRRGTRVSR